MCVREKAWCVCARACEGVCVKERERDPSSSAHAGGPMASTLKSPERREREESVRRAYYKHERRERERERKYIIKREERREKIYTHTHTHTHTPVRTLFSKS